MNRRLSILFALTSVLLGAVLVSACKPEAGSQVSQPTNVPSVQPTTTATTGASVASTGAVTSTMNKPPACQFTGTAAGVTPLATESFVFSEPKVIFTSTSKVILPIYGWLPDSTQLIIDGYDKSSDRHTIEILNTQTGAVRRYAERQATGWTAWLPQQQALAYTDFENLNQSQGIYRDDLWVSSGSPQQAKRVVAGVDADSLAIDTAGRLTFFERERGDLSLGTQLQQLDATTQVKQGLPFSLAQWELPRYLQSAKSGTTQDRRLWSTWRPGKVSQILLYSMDSGTLLADLQTGQTCEVELRQLDTPLGVVRAAWSPNGRYLAILGTTGLADQQSEQFLAFDMDTGQKFIPDLGPGHLVDFEWGADSRHLVSLVRSISKDRGDVYKLYLADVVVQNVQQVLPNAVLGGGAGGNGEMSWSPDGALLAIKCPIRQSGQLVIVEDRICLIPTRKAP